MQRVIGVMIAILAMSQLACSATDMRRSFREVWRDEATKSAIRLQFVDHKDVTSRTINVDVFRGVVTLHGRVTTEQQRAAAEALAGAVPEVVMVENHLVVKSPDDPRFVTAEPRALPREPEAAAKSHAAPAVDTEAPVIGARSEREAPYLERSMLPPAQTVRPPVVKSTAPAIAETSKPVVPATHKPASMATMPAPQPRSVATKPVTMPPAAVGVPAAATRPSAVVAPAPQWYKKGTTTAARGFEERDLSAETPANQLVQEAAEELKRLKSLPSTPQ